jgi:hypothetical protein
MGAIPEEVENKRDVAAHAAAVAAPCRGARGEAQFRSRARLRLRARPPPPNLLLLGCPLSMSAW